MKRGLHLEKVLNFCACSTQKKFFDTNFGQISTGEVNSGVPEER